MIQGGFIYAIGVQGETAVKIGSTSTTVEERLQALQTGYPSRLGILASVYVPAYLRQIEKRVHALLAAHRIRGEWFAVPMDTVRLTALVREATPQFAEMLVAVPTETPAPQALPIPTRPQPPMPCFLVLGAPIGIWMQKHYALDFLLRQRLVRVDPKDKIALVDPPSVYANVLPSTMVHSFRSYVIDEGQDVAQAPSGYPHYQWRYGWMTHCGTVTLRVTARTHEVMTMGTRCTLTAHVPPGYTQCAYCLRQRRNDNFAKGPHTR